VVRLNGDEVTQIRRLGSGQNFICKRQDLVFDALSYFDKVEGM